MSETTSKAFKPVKFDSYHNIINGELRSTEKTRHGINPATLEPNPEVPVSTKKDVDDAVHAARIAFRAWSKTPFEKRAQAVVGFAAAIEMQKEDFIQLLTREQGMPLAAARAETLSSIENMIALSKIGIPEEVMEDSDDRTVIIRYVPLGVNAAIVPWNSPITLCLVKVAPAVLTGCCVIVKPSPFTPYNALKLIELAQQFFPPGVIQALSGDDNLGPWLTAHNGIDMINFTGSTATGRKVMESASKTLKRITLELGGNDPAIICKSVNIAKIAPRIADYAFGNSGQVCLALKRIYIHRDIFSAFRAAMVAHTKTMKVGDGTIEGTTHGPVQNLMQFERVKEFFNEIEKESWRVAVGGTISETMGKGGRKGYYVGPTIIDRPDETSRIVVEEPFGPIVPILTWTDEDDVIARANNTQYGLGASVWSSDLVEARRIAEQLEAGNVWVNSHSELDANWPFGGHKQSGIGIEQGLAGMKSFCNVQILVLKKQV